ncbi:hypothetical protein [Sedimenticola hydrogenitrophicus]|uniref:hypothetical protein n=1 Tax=Sedimenticola hydrogenitrophicus TaxID=2967975 RepID=UPI0023AEB420|nr:hypothetical protein [Sedimenticola hydrogenitrophicus]
MFLKENSSIDHLPLYEVKELSVEEALLVLAAEKETLLQRVHETALVQPRRALWFSAPGPMPAAV